MHYVRIAAQTVNEPIRTVTVSGLTANEAIFNRLYHAAEESVIGTSSYFDASGKYCIYWCPPVSRWLLLATDAMDGRAYTGPNSSAPCMFNAASIHPHDSPMTTQWVERWRVGRARKDLAVNLSIVLSSSNASGAVLGGWRRAPY